MSNIEKLAKENGMTVEFVNWFFETKKDGCGNAWFMMMAAMWEGWKSQEARCRALAAENAGLKEANGIALKILNDEETMVTSLWASSVQKVEVETPATDAFLAEVRAQQCEAICCSLLNKASEYEERAKGTDSFGTDNRYRFAAAMFRGFAAQLREGAAQ